VASFLLEGKPGEALEQFLEYSFRLAGKPLDYLRVVEEKLRELGVVRVYPGYCIGRVAATRLLEAFQGEELGVGFTLEVDH